MPTYAYKCNDCETKYEVFHKTIQQEAQVECPSCHSENSKKLMSAASIGGFSMSKSYNLPTAPPCATGGCASGMCGLN